MLFLVVLVVFGAISLFPFTVGPSITWFGGVREFELYDVFLLLFGSAVFVVFSGLAVTIALTFFLYGQWRTWYVRAWINSTLFLVHFAVFYFLYSAWDKWPTWSELLSWPDVWLLISGMFFVFVAELTTNFIFGGFQREQLEGDCQKKRP